MMAQSFVVKGPANPKPYEQTAIQEMNDYLAKRIGGHKLVIGGKAMNSDPKGVVNSFMFGDGSSTVHGVAEVVEVRAAANKLLRPTGKK